MNHFEHPHYANSFHHAGELERAAEMRRLASLAQADQPAPSRRPLDFLFRLFSRLRLVSQPALELRQPITRQQLDSL